MSDDAEARKVAARIRRKLSPGQTPDQESSQIDKLVQDWAVGFSQELRGEATNQFIEEYLNYHDDETRAEIEYAVQVLHSLKDFGRFRRKMIAMFAAVYANGVLHEREGTDFDFEKLGEAAGRKIHARHKSVLKPIPADRDSS
ncbi:MAG: hypothetical protein WA192_05585 [Candidatus Acidiferrales bacterium]